MDDQHKTKSQLIAELAELRERVAVRASSAGGDASPSDPRWHSLVARTPVFILMLDRDHRILFINHTEPGESTGDVIGKTPYDYCLPEFHNVARTSIEKVFNTGEPASYEAEALRPEGQRVWYHVYLGPVYDGGEVCAVSMIAENVTAKKRVEQERDRAQAIANAAVECLPFDFFALGPDGRYIMQNATSREHYGDVVGKTPEDVRKRTRTRLVARNQPASLRRGTRRGEVETNRHGETATITTSWPRSAATTSSTASSVSIWISPRGNGRRRRCGRHATNWSDGSTSAPPNWKRPTKTCSGSGGRFLHMLRASDHERQIIAYDIHDGLAQQLAAAIMQFQTYEQPEEQHPAKPRRPTTRASRCCGRPTSRRGGSSAASGRRSSTSRGSPPPSPTWSTNSRASAGPKIEFHSDVKSNALPPILENAVYRIAQEALANACKHSRSKKVRVSLVQEGDRLRLEVQDWGVGFDPESVPDDRFGLEGIRERTRLLGGQSAVEKAPGKGTRVRVSAADSGAGRIRDRRRLGGGGSMTGRNPDHKELEMRRLISLTVVLGVCAMTVAATPRAGSSDAVEDEALSRLCVVWSSSDPGVAKNVCFMYTLNAKRQAWFDVVHLVVWGPSAKRLAEDEDLQDEVKAMRKAGVVVEACVACADNYGVAGDLKSLGIDVKPMRRAAEPPAERAVEGADVLSNGTEVAFVNAL